MPVVDTDEGPRLELRARIGRGSMGEVWRGQYADDSTEVAVKLLARLENRPQTRTNFLQEVRAQAALQHPGIVQVLGYGQFESGFELRDGVYIREGTPYLTMELSRYGTLREVEIPTSWEGLESLLFHVLDALAFAHARNMIHRDLKPENILLYDDAHTDGDSLHRFKLTDFGIAHAINLSSRRESKDVFQPEAGTPYYMAPEQIRGKWRTFGAWTDLYSLGAVAYELAAGQPPFPGDDLVEIASSHLSAPIPPLEPRFSVPDRFESWLRKMLAKDQPSRFSWASDAAWALEQLEAPDPGAETSEVEAVEIAPRETPVEPEATTLESSAETTRLRTTEPFAPTKTLFTRTNLGDLDSNPQWTPLESSDFGVPPMPNSWEPDYEFESERPVRISQKLFKLRDVPFVGRRRERDAIWGALSEVIETGDGRAVLIEGPPGIGKTRLATWMGHRTRELGQATFLDTSFRPDDREQSEISYIGRSWLRAWGLDRDEAITQIRSKVASIVADDTSEEELERRVRQIAVAIFEAPRIAEVDAPRAHEQQVELVSTIFRNLSFMRPLFILFDNVQWSPFALDLTRRFIAESSSIPVLVALTNYQPPNTRGGSSDSAKELEEIRRVDSTRHLPLEPLPDDDIAEMITKRIELESSTLEILVDLANGYPRTAIEHLHNWVGCGNLVRTRDGYRLKTTEGIRRRDD